MWKIDNIIREFPQAKFILRINIVIVSIMTLGMIIYQNVGSKTVSFCPCSGRVQKSYVENFMRAGIYYQRIILENDKAITANGFVMISCKKKVRLIDFILDGDSVQYNSIDTLYVYRNDYEVYKFLRSVNDFK